MITIFVQGQKKQADRFKMQPPFGFIFHDFPALEPDSMTFQDMCAPCTPW